MNRKVVSEDVLFCLFARFVLRTLNISFCGLQFAAIGRNYTQVVEDIRRKFGDRRAAIMLTPLAKATIELVKLSQAHKSMTEDFRTTVVDYHWNGNK